MPFLMSTLQLISSDPSVLTFNEELGVTLSGRPRHFETDGERFYLTDTGRRIAGRNWSGSDDGLAKPESIEA